MTDRNGESHVERPRTTAPAWLFVGDRRSFWWLASAVFAANGLISAWQHTWWLAVMQIVTAMLAVRAAALARVNDVGIPPRGE